MTIHGDKELTFVGATNGKRGTSANRRVVDGRIATTTVMEAIYQRRAVRSYTGQPVEPAVIDLLLNAAVQAPSAVNQQPWAFAVVQDKAVLRRYSDRAKAVFLDHAAGDPGQARFLETLSNPDYNIFYDAGTLVVICGGPGVLSTAEDCCLAGENLMLAACALGLGTCPIGFARPMLNLVPVICGK